MIYKVTIAVGRFQLPHKPHIELIKKALDRGEQTIVFLGSAFHARTIKNCFTWEEREQMIRLCLTNDENERTTFIPIRDYNDNQKWFGALLGAVAKKFPDVKDHDIRVVGHFKDASSAYLKQMPWEVIETGSLMNVDATNLRTLLYESINLTSTFSLLQSYIHEPIVDYLRSWALLPYIHDLREEYFKIKHEIEEYGGKYGVTADLFLEFFLEDDPDPYVLLIERGRAPGKGLLALPGGFYDPDRRETLFQTALRETIEETQHNIWENLLRESFVAREWFDAPDRSVRRNIMTMAHHFRMHGKELPLLRGAIDRGESHPKFMKKSVIAHMEENFFDDHFSIINHFSPLAVEG